MDWRLILVCIVLGLVFDRKCIRSCCPAGQGRGRASRLRETLKVGGRWAYLYRAIDRDGRLVGTMLSEYRDMAAAQAFFRSDKVVTGVTPDQVTTDGHCSYPRAIRGTLGRDVVHRPRRLQK